ncbi:copper chaperone [Symbiobacterium terraclitae]|uniref:Copper chaperone n=1 Tax=Symbiobacterium terraclitae TaxID=557451 RepID=A0ABS4JQG8_9FIRM|nr:copper chaperone [Symbiobacterium terraclitae]
MSFRMTTVKIAGMSCNHCVMGVKRALSAIPGIENLEVKVGEARFDGNVDLEAVKAAIEDEGYQVISVA